jgi:competence protein ComEA
VGEVQNPGVYQLASNSRVLDAIFASGGFTKDADQASINLARLVNDGEQILVLARGTQSQSSSGGQTGLVNLNFADASQLDALPGIGPTLAQRIVDYRKANGGFTSLGDLGKVAGFGPSVLGKLTDLVTF